MSSDPSGERVENSKRSAADESARESGDIFADKSDAPRRTRPRQASKKRPSGRGHKNTAALPDPPPDDDTDDRFREQAAQILAATRDRIVERPLQAVLLAAAVGAFTALLLGAGRR